MHLQQMIHRCRISTATMTDAVKSATAVVERARLSSARRYVVSAQTKQRSIIKMQTVSAASLQNAVRFFRAALPVLAQSTRSSLHLLLNAHAQSACFHSSLSKFFRNNFCRTAIPLLVTQTA